MSGAGRWTAADAFALNGRAAAWMLGATLPVASVLGMLLAPLVSTGWDFDAGSWWGTIGGVVGWAVLVDGVSAVFVLAAAFATVPVTWAAGRVLERVRRPGLQVAATAVLAGSMAAVPAGVLGVDGLVFTVPISLAAGAAGALARRGQLRSARARG